MLYPAGGATEIRRRSLAGGRQEISGQTAGAHAEGDRRVGAAGCMHNFRIYAAGASSRPQGTRLEACRAGLDLVHLPLAGAP